MNDADKMQRRRGREDKKKTGSGRNAEWTVHDFHTKRRPKVGQTRRAGKTSDQMGDKVGGTQPGGPGETAMTAGRQLKNESLSKKLRVSYAVNIVPARSKREKEPNTAGERWEIESRTMPV